MENDREQLEYAAKAAGYELDYTIRPDGKAFYHSEKNALALSSGGWFAPLTDDGDALRLAVKLGLTVDMVELSVWHKGKCVAAMSAEGDPYAAARRAIVRAAAEIGRNMK